MALEERAQDRPGQGAPGPGVAGLNAGGPRWDSAAGWPERGCTAARAPWPLPSPRRMPVGRCTVRMAGGTGHGRRAGRAVLLPPPPRATCAACAAPVPPVLPVEWHAQRSAAAPPNAVAATRAARDTASARALTQPASTRTAQALAFGLPHQSTSLRSDAVAAQHDDVCRLWHGCCPSLSLVQRVGVVGARAERCAVVQRDTPQAWQKVWTT